MNNLKKALSLLALGLIIQSLGCEAETNLYVAGDIADCRTESFEKTDAFKTPKPQNPKTPNLFIVRLILFIIYTLLKPTTTTQSTLLKKSTNSLKFILSFDFTPAIFIIATVCINKNLTVNLIVCYCFPKQFKDFFQILIVYVSFPKIIIRERIITFYDRT